MSNPKESRIYQTMLDDAKSWCSNGNSSIDEMINSGLVTESGIMSRYYSNLVSKSNGWDRIIEFCEKDHNFSKYYKDSEIRLVNDNCQSHTTMIIVAIQDILDRIDE